jgi:hypothetical protein
VTKIPDTTQMPTEVVPAEIREQIKEVVFGTPISRSVEVEPPDVIVQATRDRIWANLSGYLTSGDWADRRRTAAEIDAEDAARGERP